MEEDGVILDGCIKTQDPGEIADFSFADDGVINKVTDFFFGSASHLMKVQSSHFCLLFLCLQIILRSEFLKEILDEMDSTSEYIGIELSESYPYFRFYMSSRLGESEVSVEPPPSIPVPFLCSLSPIISVNNLLQFQVEKTSDMIEYFDCKIRTAFR